MVKLTYEFWDDGEKMDGPFEREFESESLMYGWLRSQHGHPFLYVKVVSIRAVVAEQS